MEDAILVRQLNLSDSHVIVRIFRPEKDPSGHDYYCVYRIEGLSRIYTKSIFGADEIQALLLSLKAVGVDLYCSEEYRNGQLYWLEKGNGDLGFPLPDGFDLSVS